VLYPYRTPAAKIMASNKEKITFLICVNKTGSHKMKPLMIGKSKSLRCFKINGLSQEAIVEKVFANTWKQLN
jgi:hypothetical protein